LVTLEPGPVEEMGVDMKKMNAAIFVLGTLSSGGMIMIYLALHDIWHDYASPEVWIRAGKTLPDWYSANVNRCPLEWGVIQMAFLLILAFHILLFIRMLKTPRQA
jgi:hypothetical protein